jgi:hypothetical protein
MFAMNYCPCHSQDGLSLLQSRTSSANELPPLKRCGGYKWTSATLTFSDSTPPSTPTTSLVNNNTDSYSSRIALIERQTYLLRHLIQKPNQPAPEYVRLFVFSIFVAFFVD